MQNKGAIKTFAIILSFICIYQLLFTFFTRRVENRAVEYASNYINTEKVKTLLKKKFPEGNILKEKTFLDSISNSKESFYLDSMSNEVIYNILIRKYTYKDCKEREINLGLDLKGGMNVTLEVSVADIIKGMARDSKDTTLNKAIAKAYEMQRNSQEDFVTLFGKAFEIVAPNEKLAAIFNTVELKGRVNYNSTNEEVLNVIEEETDGAISRTFNILRTRIDRFGVAQPNIQKSQIAGRILVELPGIKNPERVRKLLQGTAKLEFWETYEYKEIYPYLTKANDKLKATLNITDDTINNKSIDTSKVIIDKKDTTEKKSLIEQLKGDTTSKTKQIIEKEGIEDNPLFTYLRPALVQDKEGKYYLNKGPVVGYATIIDTAYVNSMLNRKEIKSIFPKNLILLWTVKPYDKEGTTLQLIAIKTARDGSAALSGSVIINARQDFGRNGGNEISMNMNSEGARAWKRLTANNIEKSIAIVLDNYVYSFPTVKGEIPNGRSQITGNFTLEEAKDLANILEAGKLPAPAKIVEEAIVGPSLGKEAIHKGLMSFILAFVIVLLYMLLYYNIAGRVADIALFSNMFFLFGVLASLQAVLTLPGMAGIVLTLGMSVDANVIIYERIKEEVRAGKGIRLAISDGYKNAYSAIIDGNVTTLLSGVVLFIFGSGPVQGFATTLIIGILTSMFSAIFISRLIFIWMLDRNKKITYDNKINRNFFTKVNIDFIGKRKIFYVISSILIIIGLISLFTKGLSYGVDFSGGRTYIVRFDEKVKTNEIRSSLAKEFDETSEVKIFGPNNQVKITTKYLIDDNSVDVDSIIESKLYKGLKQFYKKPITYKEFSSDVDDKSVGKLSSQKVGPTIADDIKNKAKLAVTLALIIIFVYVGARFRKWQFGVGGVITLIHDALIAMSLYSVFYGIVPFTLEVDQSFIAAILTIIGYSINDSVVIFDRIREYNHIYPKRELKSNINGAVNSTLGRTFNTSVTTFFTLLIIFIFGGEIIRGFSFALMVGVIIGTYSSIFVSTPVAYDFMMMSKKSKELEQKKK